MQHVIKKQILEIQLDDKQDAFHRQQQVRDFYYKQIVPQLDKIFNELAGENETISLDKLEVDLGEVNLKALELNRSDSQWYEILLSQVTAAIRKIERKEEQEKAAYPLSVANQWLFYMQHGYLAWNTLEANESWYEKVLEAFATDFVSVTALRCIILSDKIALRRIVSQHTENFKIKLTEILTAQNQTDLLSLVEELATLVEATQDGALQAFDKSSNRKIVWQSIIAIAASSESNLTPARLAKLVAEEVLSSQTIADPLLKSLDDKLRLPIVRQVIKEGRGIPKKIETLFNKMPNLSPDDKASAQLEQEGIFVRDAGLILIHPFLTSFFNRLGLTQNGKFNNSAARQKAIHLLFYLAQGRLAPEEHQLVIPKLLCGHALGDTVDEDILLGESEINEAEDLLQAVVAQWNILKNTSTAGLQECFLRRNGKLYSKDENLYLQVETSSIDILLDHLPWVLSMIKLPWMDQLLRVEWR